MKTFTYVPNLPDLPKLPTKEVDGKRWYVTPSGKEVPSVTTVLSHFKKQKLNEWRNRVGTEEANKISATASRRGTKFHTLMERYLENKPIEDILTETVMPDQKQAFKDMMPVANRIDNIHYVECQLYSEEYGIAGRTDVIGEFDGIKSVIDFKTSLKPKKEEWITDYFEQAIAYSLMYHERVGIKLEQVVILVSVDQEPEPQVFIKKRKDLDFIGYKISLYNKIHSYMSQYSPRKNAEL